MSFAPGSAVVVDADSHVIEPPGAWEGNVPSAFCSRVPTLVQHDGTDWLELDGALMQSYGVLSGLARQNRSLPGGHSQPGGTWQEAILPGGYEPAARLVDMDRDGIAIAILYPTMAMSLFGLADRQLARVLVEGYNRWVCGFAAHCPARLKAVGLLLPEDPAWVKAEVDRCKAAGMVQLLVPGPEVGLALHDQAWDPVWRAAEDAQLPVGIHAFGGRVGTDARSDGLVAALVDRTADAERAMVSLVFGGVFDRFPGLRVVSVENEASWAAGLIARADVSYRRGRRSSHALRGCSRPPSEVFHDHVFFTFIHDQAAIDSRRVIGTANLMWSTDYPHNASTWPESMDWLGRYLRPELGAREVAALIGANAAALYGLDLAAVNRTPPAAVTW